MEVVTNSSRPKPGREVRRGSRPEIRGISRLIIFFHEVCKYFDGIRHTRQKRLETRQGGACNDPFTGSIVIGHCLNGH